MSTSPNVTTPGGFFVGLGGIVSFCVVAVVVYQWAKSPAEMVTSASLRTAYNRGGMEALEEQCDRAARILGQGLLSMKDVVEESNG